MSTDINISGNSLHAAEYTTMLDMEIQREQSEFSEYATMQTHEINADRRQAVVRYGKLKMRAIEGINDKIVDDSLSYTQRWYEGELKSTSAIYNLVTQGPLTRQNVQAGIVKAQAAAVNREKDSLFLRALFAPSLTQASGSTSVSYDSGNTIAVNVGAGANTGLNLTKIEAVKKRMERQGLTRKIIQSAGGVGMILTEETHQDLRVMVETSNDDFSKAYSVVRDADGNIEKFYGFDIKVISTLDLATDFPLEARLISGSFRRIPVFVKGAIGMGTWASQFNKVTDVTDIEGDAKRFYALLNMGATRLDEKLVYDILVTDPTLA